ncbi:hypothetical protein [Undibacterium sp. TS12]|uniref:hypothetical protein n=1 Tax=Undibacterium sp. TS12 TaxID=2908202 RepID=UPI001F4C779F|nr:hypothetical protein [Undibacterium sp. TS12]MCH8623093.1 hypothetical protein [Undibacterium sp. TS12]
MGSIKISGTRLFAHSQNTLTEFDREIELKEVERVLDKLANADFKNKICYLYGMGAHPRSTYELLRKKSGLKVIFFRSVLSKKLWFLKWLIASYEGLIRVDQHEILPETFLTLMSQSMVALYIMKPELEAEFVSAVTNREHKFIDFGVKTDPSYSMYIVDADNAESTTGMVEVISYGHATPHGLIPIT